MTRTRWDIVAVALLAGVAAGAHVGKVAPVLPELRADLGLGLLGAGWIASAIAAVTAASGLAVGALADRLGARRLLTVCLALLAGGAAVGGLAGTGTLLLAARLVEAAGFAGIVVGAPRLIVLATAPSDRSAALGIWAAYMPAGMALAMLAAPLLAGIAGWRGLWAAGAALALAILAVAFVVLRPSRWGQPPRPPAAPGLLRDAVVPGPWLFGASFLVYALLWFAVMAWLPTFLVAELHWHGAAAAVTTALVVGANAAGNLVAAWLLHRGVARWRLAGLALAAMTGCGALLFGPLVADPAKLPLALAFSLLGGMLPAAALSGAPAHLPGRVALANGILVQGSGLGSLLGPPALALAVGADGGWDGAWRLMAAAAPVAAVLVVALRRVERRG